MGIPLNLVLLAGLLVVPRLLSADTTVNGTITASTTWTLAESPYVVTGSINVAGRSSPVLTVEPGVVVKVNSGQGMWIGNQGPGGLNAVGTAEQPVRFTSESATVTGGQQ